MANSSDHQQFNIGVKAMILQDNRLLLLKRRDHGVWEVPGGRINVGESLEETLCREIPEELPGARLIAINRLLHAEQTDFKLPNGNSLMLLFYDVEVELPPTSHLSEEHTALAFATSSNVSDYELQPSIDHAAKIVLE